MGKKKKLHDLRGNISDNALRAKYLLENAIYKSESESESFTLGVMALELVEEIKTNSERIGKILGH